LFFYLIFSCYKYTHRTSVCIYTKKIFFMNINIYIFSYLFLFVRIIKAQASSRRISYFYQFYSLLFFFVFIIMPMSFFYSFFFSFIQNLFISRNFFSYHIFAMLFMYFKMTLNNYNLIYLFVVRTKERKKKSPILFILSHKDCYLYCKERRATKIKRQQKPKDILT
jgi:hypothetical protein